MERSAFLSDHWQNLISRIHETVCVLIISLCASHKAAVVLRAPLQSVFRGPIFACYLSSRTRTDRRLASASPLRHQIMDSQNPTAKLPKRLTKPPPPPSNSSINSSMNQNTPGSLHRQPSSSQSPASSQDHRRTPSYHTSSSSSLEPSPHPSHSQHSESHANRYPYASRQSFDFDETTSDEFNAHPGTLSTLDSTKASGYQNSLRRPAPPPLSYTSPNAKIMSPSLRQSSSFSMGDRSNANPTPPDGDSVSISSSKRYSDEAGKNSTPWKKKSGISTFFGNVLGSPRTNGVKISAPENPVHVTHVGFDNETGQFTVCMSKRPISYYHEDPLSRLHLHAIRFTKCYTCTSPMKRRGGLFISP